MKMQNVGLFALPVAIVMAGVTAQSPANVVFQDDFDNGVPTQTASESPTNWVYATGGLGGDISTAAESGGVLTLTANTASGSIQPSANMALRAAQSSMNFWAAPVTMTITGTSTFRAGSVITAGRNLFAAFVSQAENTNAQNSALEVRLFAEDHIRLGWKANATGRPSNNIITASLQIGSAFNTITGIEFALDGTGSQLQYELRFPTSISNTKDTNHDGWITYQDTGMSALKSALSTTDTATLLAAWLADNGVGSAANAQAAITFATQRTNSTIGETSIVNIDQVTVSAIPEPATLGLLALGGLMMIRRRNA